MQQTRQKICPTCNQLNPLGAIVCTYCSHKFSTQFTAPNQTQVFNAPLQPAYPVVAPARNRLAWFWYRCGNALIVSGCVALAGGVIWFTSRALVPPAFIGTWKDATPLAKEQDIVTFRPDHTGEIVAPNDRTDFVWRQDGNFLLLSASKDIPIATDSPQRNVAITWSMSDSGDILTLTANLVPTRLYRQGK